MKIITYNLHYGGHTRRDNHWERMLAEFAPDLILAQESFNPAEYFTDSGLTDIKKSVVWQSLPSKWGSAIFAPRHKVHQIPIPTELQGWVTETGARPVK